MRLLAQHLSSPSGGRGATAATTFSTSRWALALEQHEDLSVSEGSAAAVAAAVARGADLRLCEPAALPCPPPS